MDKDWTLFDLNRETLKKIFFSLSKPEKKLPFVEFQKFCIWSKLIPSYISQSQLKTLITRSSSSSNLSKLQLPYEHFEYLLKSISLQKSSSLSKAEKIKTFFTYLSTTIKQNFILNASLIKTSINRSSSSYSLKSSQDLNESNSSLDLSIKEALNTLRSSSRKSSTALRLNLSPPATDRIPSDPGTPRSRSLRRYQDFKPKAVAQSQSIKNLPKLKEKKNLGELDEFLETERMVQDQYLPGKKFNDVGKTVDDKKNAENLKKISMCRGFIVNKMSQGFTAEIVKRVIFCAWKKYKFE